MGVFRKPPRGPAEPSSGRPAFLRLKPRPVRRMRKPLIFLCSAVAVALLASCLLGDRGLKTFLELRAEQKDLEAEVRTLRLREMRLQADLDALADDPDALERVARERYRMLRDGERIIEVVEDREPDAPRD